MSRHYTTVYKEVEVDVELADFEDEDLIAELNRRDGQLTWGSHILIQKIWHNRRTGQDYQKELDDLIYETIGKVL